MTVDPLLAAYLTFTFVLAATPGSTTAVVVRNTLSGGRHAGLAAAAGAATGNMTQATAAGLGLAIIFARWPAAIIVLRWLGALYLAGLGASSLWRGARHPDGGFRLASGAVPRSPGERRDASFRQGLTVNLLNPAISTFYLVVVPSFVPVSAPRWYFAALAAMHIGIAFICHALWSLAFDRLRALFHSAPARRLLETATGLALIALAARIVADIW